MINLALRCIFVHTSKASLTCREILRHGPTALLPSEGSRAADFYRP
jgi:hypothetical protein